MPKISASLIRIAMLALAAGGLCCCARSAPGPRQTPELPQGPGVAARHPGDRGIAGDRSVLFADDFETGGLEAIKKHWGGEASDNDGKVMSLSADVPPGSAGKRSLEMTATMDENSGGHLYTVFKGVDRAFVRFYTKFAPDAAYEHHFVELGGYSPPTPYPNPRAGTRPAGDDRLMVFIDGDGRYGRYPPPGVWTLYTYWPEMKISADQHYWGNCLSPVEAHPLPRGRWQCVELMIKLNTPGQADGELALWLDGKLVEHVKKGVPRGQWSGMGFDLLRSGGEPFEGLVLRTGKALQINHLWLEHYIDAGPQQMNRLANPTRVNRVWFDHVVVSTEYIGPIQPLQ